MNTTIKQAETETLDIDPRTGEPAGVVGHIRSERFEALPLVEDMEAQRVANLITPKSFLADRPVEFYNQFQGRPRGAFYVRLGFLEGQLYGSEERSADASGRPFPYGPSIFLIGDFEAIVDATGEILQAREVILPKALGRMVHDAWQQARADNAKPSAQLRVEIGIEPSGRQVPYQYVITQYTLKRPASRAARLAAWRTAAIEQDRQLALPAPKASAV